MAPKEGKKSNKQTIEIVIIVIIFAVIGFLLYRNFAGTSEEIPVDLTAPVTAPAQNTNNPRSEQVNSAEVASSLNDISYLPAFLDQLVKFGNWPVEFDPSTLSTDYGRANPFVPLNKSQSGTEL